MTTVDYPQNGWLFPDKRPFWDKTRPDLPYSDAQPKGTEMTARKNTTAQTAAKTTTKKGTTMTTKKNAQATTNETPLTGKEKRAADLAALKAKYDAPAFETVINIHNVLKAQYEAEHMGKDSAPKPLYATDDEIEYLCWFANEQGWTNNAFVSKSQLPAVHGTPREGAVSVKLFGPMGRPGTYFNYDDIEWEYEEGPVYDPEVAAATKKAFGEKRKANRANVQQLGLPNGTVMMVDINNKRAMANYLAACNAINAAMTA